MKRNSGIHQQNLKIFFPEFSFLFSFLPKHEQDKNISRTFRSEIHDLAKETSHQMFSIKNKKLQRGYVVNVH